MEEGNVNDEQLQERVIGQIMALRRLQAGTGTAGRARNSQNTQDLLDSVLQLSLGKAAMESRIALLESLPSNLSNDDNFKLKALINLKALNLLDIQTRLRKKLLDSTKHPNSLSFSPLVDRSLYVRTKVPYLLPEPPRRKTADAKPSHKKYLDSIQTHAHQFRQFFAIANQAKARMGGSVLRIHIRLEKEEQQRAVLDRERRIRALRSNDEKAYLELLDKGKDIQIMKILNQTTDFIAKLTGAVESQRETISSRIAGGPFDGEEIEEKDGDDYYNTAHKIREKVTEQPNLLVGGKLKEYQIK
ncbi:RSC chromatin remodeling complex ATPase component, partial [Nowakowskiella sp. JEL0078]